MQQTLTSETRPATQGITKEQFFQKANGRARTRTFGEFDWLRFKTALGDAEKAAENGEGFYQMDDAGGVANSYGYTTTSARWGVWVDPITHAVAFQVDRPRISGRHVSHAYKGGDRSYHSHFSTLKRYPLLRQYAVEAAVSQFQVFQSLGQGSQDKAIAYLRAISR